MPETQMMPQPRGAVSSNAIVAGICAVIALFMLFIAGVSNALMRSDGMMMALARPKICLKPAAKALEPTQEADKR